MNDAAPWALGTPTRRRALHTVLDEYVGGRSVSPARFMRAFGMSELAATCARIADHVNAPAKLAAIIAAMVRERGIDGHAAAIRDNVGVCIRVRNGHECDMTMPQARAFTLRLLDAPATTTQDVERMIAEVTQ